MEMPHGAFVNGKFHYDISLLELTDEVKILLKSQRIHVRTQKLYQTSHSNRSKR
jgi:hypothetical protein